MKQSLKLYLLLLLSVPLFFVSCNGKTKEKYGGTWVMVRSNTDGKNEGMNYALSQGLVIELQLDTENKTLRVVSQVGTNDPEELNHGELSLRDGYYRSLLPNKNNGTTVWADIKIKEDGYLHYSTGYDTDWLFEKK
jgi:hypothetical protein